MKKVMRSSPFKEIDGYTSPDTMGTRTLKSTIAELLTAEDFAASLEKIAYL